MEVVKKEQSPCPVVTSGSKQRYTLRWNTRSKPPVSDASESSSASRRVRPLSSVSQSVGVPDLSAKGKSAKPPRRHSIPTKSSFSPHQASVGSITPISETRLNRPIIQGKSDTPLSDVSKSSSRCKFNVLSSVSYWLTQIKLSETACKHSVSLGFFKLALESGCEPLQRVREELKSYVHKHNLLAELGEAVKDALQSYSISEEEFEQLKLNESSSQLQDGGSGASKQDARSSSVSTGAGNLKPKSLISKVLSVAESNKKGVDKRVPAAKDRALNIKNPSRPASVKDSNVNSTQKRSQKPMKVESNCCDAKVKDLTKQSVSKEADSVPAGEIVREDKDIIKDKENMESQLFDGTMLEEEIETN